MKDKKVYGVIEIIRYFEFFFSEAKKTFFKKENMFEESKILAFLISLIEFTFESHKIKFVS